MDQLLQTDIDGEIIHDISGWTKNQTAQVSFSMVDTTQPIVNAMEKRLDGKGAGSDYKREFTQAIDLAKTEMEKLGYKPLNIDSALLTSSQF